MRPERWLLIALLATMAILGCGALTDGTVGPLDEASGSPVSIPRAPSTPPTPMRISPLSLTPAPAPVVLQPEVTGGSVGGQFVNPGDCVNFPHTPNILLGVTLRDGLIVDCSTTWDFRVLNNFEVDRDGDYPDHLYFQREAFSRCDRHYTLQIPPGEEAWADGNRVVTCLQESFLLPRYLYSLLDRRVTGKLRVGECVRLRGDFFDVVPCDDEQEFWHFQIVNSITLDSDDEEYPGQRFFEQQYREGCDTELADDFLYPEKRYWELGDRTIHCVTIKRATTTAPLQGGP